MKNGDYLFRSTYEWACFSSFCTVVQIVWYKKTVTFLSQSLKGLVLVPFVQFLRKDFNKLSCTVGK